jgi:NADPH-dependent ferric siderophore reductase
VRHELRLRQVSVAQVEQLAPRMTRVTLRGDDLKGFTSPGFDDHVKVFFPAADGKLNLPVIGPNGPTRVEGSAPPISRDFTPRRFDPERGELTIDFFLHEDGPATTWAAQTAIGETIGIGGPRGSAVIALEGIETHLFIGDETALPAIARRLDELPASTRAIVIVEVEPGFEISLRSRADLEIVWVARKHAPQAPGQQLIDALRATRIPADRCFAWAATETQAARALRNHLLNERGFAKPWVKAAGYWQRGAVGSHVVVDD